MPRKSKKVKVRNVGGDVGSDIGKKVQKEIEKLYNKTKEAVGMARGGMARGGMMAHGGMPMPAHGWGDFVNDLKSFDFNTAKRWFGLKRGGSVFQ